MMHGLAADLSFLYEKFAPEPFDNQVNYNNYNYYITNY